MNYLSTCSNAVTLELRLIVRGGVAEQSKASGEKGWCCGFESQCWQLAISSPSSGKTCCYIKGQSFSYYVYVVWEVKEPLGKCVGTGCLSKII